MRPMLLANEPKLPSRRAIYRFFRDTGEAGISIALLSLADVLAAYDQTLSQEVLSRHLDVIRLLLDAYWERPLEIVSPPALLEGREIIKTYKLKPGPLVGKLLEAVREAQAAGEVQTKGDALQLIERILVEDKK
jgi:poly(A) polymerase